MVTNPIYDLVKSALSNFEHGRKFIGMKKLRQAIQLIKAEEAEG